MWLVSLTVSLVKLHQNADDCQVYVIITLMANEASVAVDRFTLCRSMDGHDQAHVDWTHGRKVTILVVYVDYMPIR